MGQRDGQASRTLYGALGVLCFLAACEEARRPRRAIPAEPLAPIADADTVGTEDVAITEFPFVQEPGIAYGPLVDAGSAQCPGLRLVKLERRNALADAQTPTLNPLYFGRDGHGRPLSLREVLLCELRVKKWIDSLAGEGTLTILMRGPAIYEPDGDCDWREPVRTQKLPNGDRTITVHEHCRKRGRNQAPGDALVSLRISANYTVLERIEAPRRP